MSSDSLRRNHNVPRTGTDLGNKAIPNDERMVEATEIRHNITEDPPFSVPLTLAENLMIYFMENELEGIGL